MFDGGTGPCMVKAKRIIVLLCFFGRPNLVLIPVEDKHSGSFVDSHSCPSLYDGFVARCSEIINI